MQSLLKPQQSTVTTTFDEPLTTDPNIYLCGELPVVASLSHVHSPDRPALEAFIQAMFYKAHQAKVSHFLPLLLSLRDNSANLRAVCGLRHAQDAPLFLERYFDAPIEAVLSQKTGLTVARHEILEIGNLAILKPACIRSLLASITVYLHQTQAEWVVFTAVSSLKNALIKLKMPIQYLGEATLESLPVQDHASWGRYYNGRPQVIAIRRMH